MEKIVINGQKRLKGSVNISGAKNAAVAIVPAAIASGGIVTIDNLPHIEDITNLVAAVKNLGAECEFKDKHTMTIDARNVSGRSLAYSIATKMRASYYFLGSLLGRFKEAYVPLPGGCNLGTRPYDYHLKGFTALGAVCKQEHGVLSVKADKLIGAPIYLDCPSVGATINIMIAAVFAEGLTTIENAAKEPHVVDTANFLNKLGARIGGAGTNIIRIHGIKKLGGGEYTVIPDPIEAGTYMIASAVTSGDVTIENVIPKHLHSLTSKLREMGCLVEEFGDSVRVRREKELEACDIKTNFYPGFPTDLQPQMATLMCLANGSGHITENVFEHRFQYVSELKRLGADLRVSGRTAVTRGFCEYTGAEVAATDLRCGAALVIAGLAAKGETIIGNLTHIDRGYESFEQKLVDLGADIKRVDF